MQTVHIKCPHCKSEYDVGADKNSVFCMECGTTITVAEQSEVEYTYNHNENVNNNINVDEKRTYRKVDDARIREADVQETIKLKEIELELLKHKDAAAQKKLHLMTRLGVVALLVVLFITIIVASFLDSVFLPLTLFLSIIMAISIPIMFKNK